MFQLIDSAPMIWDVSVILQHFSWPILHLWFEMFLLFYNISVDRFYAYDPRCMWYFTFQLIYSTPMIWDVSVILQHFSWPILRLWSEMYVVFYISVDLFYTYALRCFWNVATIQLIDSTPRMGNIPGTLWSCKYVMTLISYDSAADRFCTCDGRCLRHISTLCLIDSTTPIMGGA